MIADLPTQIGVYVHIPWCVRKCPYCDFNSHAGQIDEAGYLAALERDLLADLSLTPVRDVGSIFFGGGTPSLFSASAIESILQLLQRHLRLASDVEITLEANPGTVEQQRFVGYRQAGVNRISLGVQSFQGGHLQRLGRIHDSDDAQRAVRAAQAAGFSRINIDLMHGLPEQTLEQALQDLDIALELGVEHLSWYQLTIEPNTAFYSAPPILPVDDLLADIQDAGHARLEQAGLKRYEISAYARPGRHSRHNLNYWRFGDYLGLGAGAHGKLTQADGTILRTRKRRQPADYLAIDKPARIGADPVTATELPLEFMMNALRLMEGVEPELYTPRTGLPLSALQAPLQALHQRGLLEDPQQRLAASATGIYWLNDILEAFLPESE